MKYSQRLRNAEIKALDCYTKKLIFQNVFFVRYYSTVFIYSKDCSRFLYSNQALQTPFAFVTGLYILPFQKLISENHWTQLLQSNQIEKCKHSRPSFVEVKLALKDWENWSTGQAEGVLCCGIQYAARLYKDVFSPCIGYCTSLASRKNSILETGVWDITLFKKCVASVKLKLAGGSCTSSAWFYYRYFSLTIV